MTVLDIRNFIRSERARRNLTVVQLAIHSGVSHHTLTRFIGREKTNGIQLGTLVRLLDSLGYELAIHPKSDNGTGQSGMALSWAKQRRELNELRQTLIEIRSGGDSKNAELSNYLLVLMNNIEGGRNNE